MLSKEQIDRLDELAAKATHGPWMAGDDDDSDYFLIGPHDDGLVSNPVVKLHSERDADYIAAANPQAVSELIAMLRESQKDTERIDAFDKFCCAYGFQDIHEGNRWIIEGPFATFRKAIDESMAYDAAMQHDCGGAHHAEGGECL